MAAAFFQDKKLQKKASRRQNALLKKTGLITDDQKLELLLDCINIGERMGVNGIRIREFVKPLLPSTGPIHDYAQRLYI